MLGGQQLQPAVLGVVGVLVLVDQHPAERARIAVADLLEELEHVDRAEQEVVEVHRVGAVQLALVVLVDVGDRLLEVGAHELAVLLGRAQLVLRVGDLGLHRARGEALDVDVEVVEAALDQPARVGRVVDRELAGVAEPVGVRPQHPGAGGVERHHPHRAHRAADEQLDPLAHLLRGLVGEGDREDLVRTGEAGADQPRDPVGEHARLARAGAGQDQQRALAVGHRVALGRVQPFEQRLGRGGPGIADGRVVKPSPATVAPRSAALPRPSSCPAAPRQVGRTARVKGRRERQPHAQPDAHEREHAPREALADLGGDRAGAGVGDRPAGAEHDAADHVAPRRPDGVPRQALARHERAGAAAPQQPHADRCHRDRRAEHQVQVGVLEEEHRADAVGIGRLRPREQEAEREPEARRRGPHSSASIAKDTPMAVAMKLAKAT